MGGNGAFSSHTSISTQRHLETLTEPSQAKEPSEISLCLQVNVGRFLFSFSSAQGSSVKQLEEKKNVSLITSEIWDHQCLPCRSCLRLWQAYLHPKQQAASSNHFKYADIASSVFHRHHPWGFLALGADPLQGTFSISSIASQGEAVVGWW